LEWRGATEGAGARVRPCADNGFFVMMNLNQCDQINPFFMLIASPHDDRSTALQAAGCCCCAAERRIGKPPAEQAAAFNNLHSRPQRSAAERPHRSVRIVHDQQQPTAQ
jgi:hypothetical protein